MCAGYRSYVCCVGRSDPRFCPGEARRRENCFLLVVMVGKNAAFVLGGTFLKPLLGRSKILKVARTHRGEGRVQAVSVQLCEQLLIYVV